MRSPDHAHAGVSQVRDEGLAWVELLVSGQASHADAEALKQWRARSPLHANSLREAMRVLRAAESIEQINAQAAAEISGLRRARPGVSRRAMVGGAIAAGVAGAMILRPPAGLWPSVSELMADERTGPGERRRLAVAPGVDVELNTRTSVAMSHDAKAAGLKLIAGEALVDVSDSARQPVFVTASGARVSAVGPASFGVLMQKESVCVTCVAGSLAIQRDNQTFSLGPRQQLVYGAAGVGAVETIDPALTLAWRRGYIIFRNTPLEDVISELNRYRSGRIVLANSGLSMRPVFGTFRIDRTDAIIAQIQKLAGARVTHLPGGVVLLS